MHDPLAIFGFFIIACLGVYIFIPNRGWAGAYLSAMTVAAFLCMVYLTKLVILA